MASFIAQNIAGPYLKDYFEPGFKGPSINTFSGTVTVENMKIKPQALDFLRLPVQIKIGYVGKIVATINYSALMSSKPAQSPVNVVVEDVFLVLGPKEKEEFDKEQYVKDMIAAKVSSLQTWQKAAFPADQEAQKAYGMVDRIIDNLNISVSNIHIRFEAEPYAFGITLKELQIVTTDENWEKAIPDKDATCIYRQLSMKSLALYMNTKDEIGNKHQMATMSMLEDIWSEDQKHTWRHLIPPISSTLRVAQEKRDEEKLAPENIPMLSAGFEFEPLGFTLSRHQYYNLLALLEDISQESAKPSEELPKFNTDPTDKLRDKYIAAYKKRFEDPKNLRQYPKVSKHEEKTLSTLEEKWSLQNTIAFRLTAFQCAKRELENENPQLTNKARDAAGGITGGITSMFVSGAKAPNELKREEYLKVLDTKSEAERKAQELLDKMKRLPQEYVATIAGLTFKKLYFTLTDTDRKLLSFEILDLRLGYKQRPQSMLAEVSIHDMTCEDHVTKNTQYRYWIDGDSKEKLVDISYETNPPVNPDNLNSIAKVRLDSVDLVVVMGLINEVSNFFTPPNPVDLSELREGARKRLEERLQDTKERLREAIEARQRNLIDIRIKAPCIVIPENPTDPKSSVLVLDLGTLLLKSRLATGGATKEKIQSLVATANSQKDLTEDYRMSLYDCFSVELADLSLFLGEGGPNWRQNNKRMMILDPLSIPLRLDNAISPALVSLPSINANGKISEVKMIVSALRVRRLLKISEALSAPSAPKAASGLDVPRSSRQLSGKNKRRRSSEIKAKDEKEKLAKAVEEEKKKIAESEKPDFRNTNYCVAMEIESVNLVIINDLESKAVDILKLKIGRISASYRQREYDMEAGLGVRSISIEDCVQTHGEAFRYMVSTNEDSKAIRALVEDLKEKTSKTESKALQRDAENFISVGVKTIQPEAKDIYDNCNSEVELHVGTLVLATNHESLPKMAYFFSYQLMPPAKKTEDEDEIEILHPAQGDVPEPEEEAPEGKKGEDYFGQAVASYKARHGELKRETNEIFLTKVNASFESLQVILCTEGKVLTRALISDFSASYTDSDEHKRAHVSLDGIWIRDLTGEAPLYPFMIECTKGKRLIDINVHMRNKDLYKPEEYDDLKSDYLTVKQTPKVELQGRISGVKVTFLNRFVAELMGYANLLTEELANQTPPEEDDMNATERLYAMNSPGRPVARSRKVSQYDFKHHSNFMSPEDSELMNMSETERKGVKLMRKWKKEKGMEINDKKDKKEKKEAIFDFYKVDLELHKIEIIVPQASKSTNYMGLTLEHIGIQNELCEDSGIPQPETNDSMPVPDISHQQQKGDESLRDRLERPRSYRTLLSLDSAATSGAASTAYSDEFEDCRDLKPVIFTRWDVILNKLQAASVFDNPREGITRDNPLPFFQIQEPSQNGKEENPIAARIVAVQTIPQLKLDPSQYPDTFVLMQVATISVIASKIQLQFAMQLSSKNLAEEAVYMKKKENPLLMERVKSVDMEDTEGDDQTQVTLEEGDEKSPEKNNEDPEAVSTMKVTVMFNNLVLKLVENPTAEVSRTLGLAWNIIIGYDVDVDGTMHVNGMLKDVTVFNTVLNRNLDIGAQLKSLSEGHYIMDPVNLSLNFSQGKSSILPNEPLMKAKVHGGFVNLRLTYQDYKLLMDSLGFLSTDEEETVEEEGKEGKLKKSAEAEEKKKALEAQPSLKKSSLTTRVKAYMVKKFQNIKMSERGYLLDPKKIKDPMVGTLKAMNAAQSYGEQYIFAKFEGVKTTLVNNVTGIDMQFAIFNLKRVKASITGFAHQQRIHSNLGVQASYYNQELEAWEPMIEPWSMDADVWTVAGQNRTVQIVTKTPFYVNLTRAMADALTSTLSLVSKVEKEKKVEVEGKMHKYSTHMLENQTDQLIEYTWHVKKELKSTDRKMQGLEQGDDCPLLYPEDARGHFVTIAIKGYEELSAFDMDNEHYKEHVLTPKEKKVLSSADKDVVVLENRVVGGLRVVSVHSTISVANETVCTMACGDITIASGEKKWVPISSSKGLQFKPLEIPDQKRCEVVGRWKNDEKTDVKALNPDELETEETLKILCSKPRTFDEDTFNFSEELQVDSLVKSMKESDLDEDLMLAPHVTVECRGKGGSCFFLAVAAHKSKKNMMVNLVVRPPVRLENLLATDASFLVTTGVEGITPTLQHPSPSTTEIVQNDQISTPLLPPTNHPNGPVCNTLEVRIARTGAFEMFDFKATDPCSVKVKVDGYSEKWSPSLELKCLPKEESPRLESVKVAGAKGKQHLFVHAELAHTLSMGLSHSRRVAVYVPYWIFDATGLQLSVSPNKSTLGPDSTLQHLDFTQFSQWTEGEDKRTALLRVGKSMGDDAKAPGKMVSFSPPGSGTRVSMKVNRPVSSRWSDYVSLDNAESQIVECAAIVDRKVDPFWNDSKFKIGLVSWEAPGKFSRTRIVNLVHRHVIVNNLDLKLEIRQHTYPGQLEVGPGCRVPFHLIHGNSKELVSFRLVSKPKEEEMKIEIVDAKKDDSVDNKKKKKKKEKKQPSAWEWSGSFKITEPGDFGLMLRAKDSAQYFLVRVEVRASDGTLFVVIDREHKKCPPFKIINRTALDMMRFCQNKVYKWTIVPPYSMATYSWDQPLGIDGKFEIAMEVQGDNKGARTYKLDDYGNLDRIALLKPDRFLYVYLLAEGPTKVLVISDLPNPDVVIDPRSSAAEQRKQEIHMALLQKINPVDVLERRRTALNESIQRVKARKEDLDTVSGGPSSVAAVADGPDGKLPDQEVSRMMTITLMEASGCSGVKWHGKSDVYGIVLFNGENKQSSVLKRNLNPWFDQKFNFDITPTKDNIPLAKRVKISLFSHNLAVPDDFLGGVVIDLGTLRARVDKTPEQVVQIQRWIKLDPLRHVMAGPASILVKFTYFPDAASRLALDRKTIKAEYKDLLRRRKVLFKYLNNERREMDGGADEKTPMRRISQAAMPMKQRLFTLRVAASKLNLLLTKTLQRKTSLDENKSVRFQEEKTQKPQPYRITMIVTHGEQKRMVILHDPSSGVPTLDSQGFPEKFEFYVDHDEVKDARVKIDCYARALKDGYKKVSTRRAKSRAEPKSPSSADYAPWEFFHIGFCDIDLNKAKESPPKPFHERAAEWQGEKDPITIIENKEGGNEEDDGNEGVDEERFYWEKLQVAHEEDADITDTLNKGGQLLISLTQSQAPPPEERPNTVATVALSEFGASMIDQTPQEIFFFQVKDTVIVYEDAPIQTTMEFSVFRTQLDNCLPNAQFPIVLAPEPLPVSEQKPMIQLSMHQSKTRPGVPVTIYQYASFLMQKLKLAIEERIMLRMLAYFNEFAAEQKNLLGIKDEDDDGSDIVVMGLDGLYPVPMSSAQKMFFSFLQLHPIALDISLELSSELRNAYASEGGLGFNPLSWLKNAAGTAIDIDEAPIRLNALTIEDAYGNSSTLLGPIVKHYTSQVIREAYKVVGSLEILGNPVQLVGNLGEGVMDFFYEPAKGLVKSPQEFGRGLAKGTTSLLKHTVTGVFGAASKVTGKLAEGIAVLAFDEEFQRDARLDSRKPPRHVGEGLVRGTKSIVLGVYRGVTGIVTDPYHGYRRQGWKGTLKGVGTGIIGIGLKPAAGTVKAASQILMGIGNTATCCDEVFENERARFPRYIGPERILRPYNAKDAAMAASLRVHEIDDLAFSKEEKSKEVYIRMFEAQTGNLVVSNFRLMLLPQTSLRHASEAKRKEIKPIFTMLWEDVKGFNHVANNLIIQAKNTSNHPQLKFATESKASKAKHKLVKLQSEYDQKKRGKIAGAITNVAKNLRININPFGGSSGSAVTGSKPPSKAISKAERMEELPAGAV